MIALHSLVQNVIIHVRFTFKGGLAWNINV